MIYDPPGFMTDYVRIPGQREQWSRAVSGWFDECIAIEESTLNGQPCQFYNQLTTPTVGEPVEQEIMWNGFSGTLRNRYGERRRWRSAIISSH